MRILAIADMPPDPDSGAAGTEYQTFAAIRQLGHEVDLLWNTDLPRRRIAHGNLHYLIELPRAMRNAVSRAFAHATYDVVHVNQPHGYLAAEWLARAHPSVPFVHRSHGLELRGERDLKPWRDAYEPVSRVLPKRLASRVLGKLLARHTHRTVAAASGHIVYVSEDRDYLVEELGVAPARIAVVAAAAPAAMVETQAPPMTANRLRTITHVSQFAFFKAPRIVADSMNALAAEDGELRFEWVCDRQHHDAVRALLSADVRGRLDLRHWMTQDDLRAVYDRAGIFLFPSFFEGFGKVFIEAMARGAIVIATDIAGARDVITDGRNGILVGPGDSSPIVTAVKGMRCNPELAASMSTAAAQRAREFTWERAARETVAFYERLRELGR
jgi:glycosyltransferase involved in cell wall biosynthesis